MSITINARGTSIPFFTIGKKGVTLYQGSSDPQLTYTMKNGDLWINDSTYAINTWNSSTTSWVPPALNYLKFPSADGTSGQVLSTNALGQLSFVNRVSTISVSSSNGLAGSVLNPTTTPVITLSTTVTGMVKGTGLAFTAAAVGTDYSAGTASLGTGILKSSTGTGILSIASAGDFPILNQNTTGTASNVTGVISIANGGSGQTTANAALNAFLPSQTGNANMGLVTNGTNTSWQTRYPTGGSNNRVFYENETNVTADYTISTGYNAMSAGPVTVNSGFSVTVPSGSVWTVV